MKENISGTPIARTGVQRKALGQMCEQLAVSNWVWRLAQLGYAAKGLLYVIVGGSAVLAILELRPRVRGTSGALNFLLVSPFGRLGVAFIALGLCGFCLRRFVQIFVSPTSGKRPGLIRRVARRIGWAFSGFAHLGVAFTAFELALGLPSLTGGASTWFWTPLLHLSELVGVSLIRVAGLAIIGFAIFQFYLSITRKFTKDLKEDEMADNVKTITNGFGIVGHAGRGLAFLISGAFLVYAGWFVTDIETGGLSQALRTLQDEPFGVLIFFAVAAGLAAYGLYLLLAALYLRLIPRW